MNNTIKYYECLDEDTRERLFSVMRSLGEESRRYQDQGNRLAAPYGSIAVGGGSFEQTLKAEVIAAYIRALQKGQTPQEAFEASAISRTECVKKWNEQRGKDYVVHRCLEAEQSLLERIHRQVLAEVK